MPIIPVSIATTGIYLPDTVLTAEALDTARGWPLGTTERRSGVGTRRQAVEGESASMMAAAALMAADGNRIVELDRLVITAIMPEQPIPTTAALTAHRLGLTSGIVAYDVNASCLGFLLGVESAATAIMLGRSSRAGVVAVELATLGLDASDETTAPLFGDGAAAAVLTRSESTSAILALRLETHADEVELCEIRAGGSRFVP